MEAPDDTLLLTASTSAAMRVLRERIPMIIEPETWPVWLDYDSNAAADLMRPARDDDVLHL